MCVPKVNIHGIISSDAKSGQIGYNQYDAIFGPIMNLSNRPQSKGCHIRPNLVSIANGWFGAPGRHTFAPMVQHHPYICSNPLHHPHTYAPMHQWCSTILKHICTTILRLHWLASPEGKHHGHWPLYQHHYHRTSDSFAKH